MLFYFLCRVYIVILGENLGFFFLLEKVLALKGTIFATIDIVDCE